MNTMTMTVETTQTLFSLMNTLTFDIVILPVTGLNWRE